MSTKFRALVTDASRLGFAAQDAIRNAVTQTSDDWSPEARAAAAEARKKGKNLAAHIGPVAKAHGYEQKGYTGHYIHPKTGHHVMSGTKEWTHSKSFNEGGDPTKTIAKGNSAESLHKHLGG